MTCKFNEPASNLFGGEWFTHRPKDGAAAAQPTSQPQKIRWAHPPSPPAASIPANRDTRNGSQFSHPLTKPFTVLLVATPSSPNWGMPPRSALRTVPRVPQLRSTLDIHMGMTSHKRQGKRILAVTLALLAASQLAGCGGGDDNDSRGSTPPPVNSGGNGGGNSGGGGGNGGGGNGGGGNNPPVSELTGVFVDAPVAGLNYTTSSNLSGITDANGRYKYNPGDTVTFSIGDLVLGTVPGQDVVTPVTVATAIAAETDADTATVAVNLLMLLQSLDANGDPNDGISFTDEIREAIAANSIDFTIAADTFTTALNSFISSVSSTSGVTLTPVSRDDAIAHFRDQAPVALAGVYVRTDEHFSPVTEKIVTLTLFDNGRYLLGGQHDVAECTPPIESGASPMPGFSDARGNGVELGSYSWNPLTNEFSISDVSIETDGDCGLHLPLSEEDSNATELEITSDGLVFRNSEGNVAYRFARVASNNDSIAGAWLQPNSLLMGYPYQFTLFPSSEDGKTGRYLMVDATPPNPAADTSPGIEEGCYSIDANNNLTVELNSSLCPSAVDTNDTAGVSDTAGDLKVFVDENGRMLIIEGDEATGFTRFPSVPLTTAALTGAWILEHEPGAELGTGAKLAQLTVFEDGRFLLGTHEDDPSCVVGYPLPDQEANGNGLEYGTLSIVSGLVVADVTVDSNGECGIHDATRTFQQRYFVAPNAAGDAFVLWANDEDDPAGVVFKRVPSVPNEIIGAWLWTDEEAEDAFAVVVYLPSGVMFETGLFPGESGIRRESFTMQGNTMTSQIAGYEHCVDTQSEVSECLGNPADRLVETYIVDGDVVTDEDGNNITRITTP
jgi:hypothetical protein